MHTLETGLLIAPFAIPYGKMHVQALCKWQQTDVRAAWSMCACKHSLRRGQTWPCTSCCCSQGHRKLRETADAPVSPFSSSHPQFTSPLVPPTHPNCSWINTTPPLTSTSVVMRRGGPRSAVRCDSGLRLLSARHAPASGDLRVVLFGPLPICQHLARGHRRNRSRYCV